MPERARFELWARDPRLLDSPIFFSPRVLLSRSSNVSSLKGSPDIISSCIACFVTYKGKSIRERIMAGRSNATDYYVETTALDIH